VPAYKRTEAIIDMLLAERSFKGIRFGTGGDPQPRKETIEEILSFVEKAETYLGIAWLAFNEIHLPAPVFLIKYHDRRDDISDDDFIYFNGLNEVSILLRNFLWWMRSNTIGNIQSYLKWVSSKYTIDTEYGDFKEIEKALSANLEEYDTREILKMEYREFKPDSIPFDFLSKSYDKTIHNLNVLQDEVLRWMNAAISSLTDALETSFGVYVETSFDYLVKVRTYINLEIINVLRIVTEIRDELEFIERK